MVVVLMQLQRADDSMARPIIIPTEETRQRICEALRIGATLAHAAEYAGISNRTMRRWIQRGVTEETGMWYELYQAIQKSRAECVMSSLLKIERASSKEWTAAAWKLERLYPHIYGKKARAVTDVFDMAFVDREEAYQEPEEEVNDI
jgi:hypothetical protein